MIRGSGGLRPFQRGIIWSINSIKYMYNDLVRRNGDIENLILLHQDNQSNLFRCLDMERLSYSVKYILKSKSDNDRVHINVPKLYSFDILLDLIFVGTR